MRKKVGIIKRALSLLLIFLLSINSFAAIVSDNDGSAFVTKAEFEALKESFASQIKNYNDSIDGKIDGSIAAYLAGINLTKLRVIEPDVENYRDMRWVNDWYTKVKRRKFTSQTTYSDQAATYNKPIWPQRRNLRCSRLFLRWGCCDDVTYEMFAMLAEQYGNIARKFNDNWYGVQEGGFTGANPIPTKYLTLYTENNQWIYNRGGLVEIKNEDRASDNAYGSIFNVPHGGTGGDIVLHGNIAGMGAVSQRTANPGEIFRYEMSLGMASDATTWDYGAALTSKNLPIVYPSLITDFHDGSTGYDITKYTKNLCYDSGKDENYNVFESRLENQAKKDDEVLANMMLGADCNTEINVGYCKEDILMGSSNNGWDWSESTLVPTDMGNHIRIYCGAPGSPNLGGRGQMAYLNGSNSNHLTLNLPLWPRKKLGELKTGKFIRKNGDYLQLNQGLPLGKMPLKGNLKIKMQYHGVNNDLDTSATVPGTQEIKLSIKKNDFTTNNDSDYLVDDKGNKIKDVVYNIPNTNFINLTMHVDDGEDIWLRMGPKDMAASGQYIVIDNIIMQVETEE